MRISKCVLVSILLLNIFCISMGETDDQTIEKPEELFLYEDLQQQFTEFKILQVREKMKIETEIKSLKTKFQNFEELHLVDKTEILNLKSEVKSLTNKILAIEGVFNPNIWIMQPPTGPPECPGQKSNSGEGAGSPGEQEKMEILGEQDLPGSHVLVGEPGVQGLKNETGQSGPMNPVGPEGKAGSKGGSGEPGPKGEIGLTGITGPKSEKRDAGIPSEFPFAEFNKINETLEDLSKSLQELKVNPKSCNEIIVSSEPSQGKQKIYPNGPTEPGTDVLCDFETDNGGWTVIQKRSSGPKEEFYRSWTDYEEGFGSLDGNFWIGLKTIHALTNDGDQELRVDLWDFEGDHEFAKYSKFSISDSSDFYRLTVDGYSGTVIATLIFSNKTRFSAKDKDNDENSGTNCAELYRGAWWYHDWTWSNLNGLYYEKGETPNPERSGMYWYYWKWSFRSLRQVEMKIRSRR